MLRKVISLIVLSPLLGFSQMNMAKLATQFPELKLPYETPADMPPNMPYFDEEPDLTPYPFIKSDVTALFEESYGMEDDMTKFYAVGKITKEKYTAVIYLLMEISKINGALSYRLFMDTYLKNGEQVASQELRAQSSVNEHEYDYNYDGPRENSYGKRISKIFTIAGTMYLETTESFEMIRSIVTNPETYDEEDLVVRKQSETNVFVIKPDGQLEQINTN